MGIADYFDDLVAFEGLIPWLYCDVRGLTTTGIGNLVASPAACAKHPWRHQADGRAALPGEAETLWAHTTDAYRKDLCPAAYRNISDLRLTKDYIQGLVAVRLETEFIPGIGKLCHDFDAWPLPARQAIVDMAYNLGVGGLAHFHNLIAACQAHDWATAAKECHRSTSREARNAFTSQRFLDALGWLCPTIGR
jgi:GH24 family phage-related lysozyme (muramidase)